MTPEFWIGPHDQPDRVRLGPAVASGSEGILYRGSMDGGGYTLDLAVKMLHPEHLAALPAWAARWNDQVELLRQVKLPGLVNVRGGYVGPLPHHPGEADLNINTLYLLMDWIEGMPLAQWSRTVQVDEPEQLLLALVPVAAALDLLHSGVVSGGVPLVHRDVKPANILIRPGGDTVLVDVGSIRGLAVDAEGGGPVGTPGYIAPEAKASGRYEPASDRYALGGVAFFLLTGQEPPLDGSIVDIERILRASPRLAGRDELVDHVLAMMCPNPEERPTSLVNWVAQLRRSSLVDLPGEATLPPVAPQRNPNRPPASPYLGHPVAKGLKRSPRPKASAPERTPRRSRLAMATAAVVAVIGLGALGMVAWRSGLMGTRAGATEEVKFALSAEQHPAYVASRTWAISGTRGDLFEGQLRVTNTSSDALTVAIIEVFPRSLIKEIGRIEPFTYKRISVDPVVVAYCIKDLAPGAVHRSDYRFRVRDGDRSRARLKLWAANRDDANREVLSSLAGDPRMVCGLPLPAGDTLLEVASLSIEPKTVELIAGTTQALRLAGAMSDASLADDAITGSAVWRAEGTAVQVDGAGVLRALATGNSRVTAQIGEISASADVRVVESGTEVSVVRTTRPIVIGPTNSTAGRTTRSTVLPDTKPTVARTTKPTVVITTKPTAVTTIKPVEPPVIVSQPRAASAFAGGQVTFRVQASGDGLAFRWERNGVPVGGATTATFTIGSVAEADNRAGFRVRVTNSAGQVVSNEALLEVKPPPPPPEITCQPQDVTVAEGGAATFRVCVRSEAPATYQWRKNGVPRSGERAPSINVSNVLAINCNECTYDVEVCSLSGCVTSEKAKLTVTP